MSDNFLVEEYPIRFIVKSMMYSYGDNDEPYNSCINFMLCLIHEQLTSLLRKAKILCDLKKSKTIGYLEIVFLFRRHPFFIKRLLQYMKIKDTIPYYLQLSTSYNKTDQIDEKIVRSKSLLDALKQIDIFNEYSSIFDPANSTVDEIKVERIRRMAIRTQHMNSLTYEKFSSARTVSFCSKNGKKSSSYSKFFLEWLGSPSLEPGVIYIINYCATEILAIMVDNAVLCSEQEMKKLSIEKDKHSSQALQLRHYKEALRRSPGYMRNRDFLFGYF